MVYDVGCPAFKKVAPAITTVLKTLTASINDSIATIIGSVGKAANRQVEIAFF